MRQKIVSIPIMFRRVFLIVVLAIFCWWIAVPGFVLAEVPEENTGIYQLGEVVVTGEREGVESAGTVREISAEDIRNSNARTLDEALELIPGLHIRIGTDGVPRVDLRGFRSRHVLLLLNGIPFNSAFDGQFDPTAITVENIAKIKVSYGSNSVLYGEGGLGGVINIITKKGKEGVQSTFSYEVRESSTHLGKFTVSGGKKNLDFFASGSLFETDGFRLSDDFSTTTEEDGGLRENSDKETDNFFANIGLIPSDVLQLGVVFNYIKGK